MGKGDKKSKRGKVAMGSYGNSRPRKPGKPSAKPQEKAKPEAKK